MFRGWLFLLNSRNITGLARSCVACLDCNKILGKTKKFLRSRVCRADGGHGLYTLTSYEDNF